MVCGGPRTSHMNWSVDVVLNGFCLISCQSFTLQVLGLATAHGCQPFVPKIIRTLAVSFGREPEFAILLRTPIIQSIAIDVEPSDLTRIFDSYTFDWWTQPGGPDACFTGDQLRGAFHEHIKVSFSFPENPG